VKADLSATIARQNADFERQMQAARQRLEAEAAAALQEHKVQVEADAQARLAEALRGIQQQQQQRAAPVPMPHAATAAPGALGLGALPPMQALAQMQAIDATEDRRIAELRHLDYARAREEAAAAETRRARYMNFFSGNGFLCAASPIAPFPHRSSTPSMVDYITVR